MEGNQPPGIINETHPLLSPLILEKLFDVIPFNLPDFRNYRLVSKAWHDLSLAKWRDNAWLSLIDTKDGIEEVVVEDGDDDDDNDDDYESVDDDIDEEDENGKRIFRDRYLELLEAKEMKLAQHPYKKFWLKKWCSMSFHKENHVDSPTFWNRVGPMMSHLTIENSDFEEVTDLRRVIFTMTPNLVGLSLIQNSYHEGDIPRKQAQRLDPKLPQHRLIPPEQVQKNLKEFVIDLPIRNDDDDEIEAADEYKFPITWMEMFIHFPDIQKLGPLQLRMVDSISQLSELFEAVEILRITYGPEYLANLCDLDLVQLKTPVGISAPLMNLLTRLKFPLKRLELKIVPSLDEETFQQFFQTCADSLQHFDLVRETGENLALGPFENFPFGLKLLNLKKFMVAGPVAPNLMFLKECPNLELLEFEPTDETRLTQDLTEVLKESGSEKLEKITDLYISTASPCDATTISMLTDLMPNVKSLHVGLDNEGFRKVCEKWKGMEHIVIDPFHIGDEGLLGKGEGGGDKFRYPNLTDLKQLKSFRMEDIEDDTDRKGLSEEAILHGILKMENLEAVSLVLSSEVSGLVHHHVSQKKYSECFIFTQEGPPGGNEWAAMAAQFQKDLKFQGGSSSK